MNQSLQKSNKPTNKLNPSQTKRVIIVTLIIAIISVLGWIIWKTYQANNLGFGDKTMWDWMELSVVPAILAILVFFLNKLQKDTELRIAEMRRLEDRELAEQRAKVDREIEQDRQQQKTLEDYLDRMTDLLLKNKLRESSPSDELRSIARTRTLTILRSLDGARKSQLVQFLYESDLIGTFIEQQFQEAILDLSYADLQELSFEHVKLSGASFPKANLRNSNFYFANLTGANFYNADLDDSNLSWAKLVQANLHAGLKRVNLVSANLENANLEGADLGGAKIWHTKFCNANLQNANFMFKDRFTYVDETDLDPASLFSVDFSGADLTGALISTSQLRAVRSLVGTILPNGQIFEEWKKSHSLKDDVNFEADSFLERLGKGIDFFEDDEDKTE